MTSERGFQIKDRPIVFFDLETTSLDTKTTRIVEIAAIKIPLTGRRKTLEMRINPGIPIPPEVTKIHGISDEDVEECPLFEAVAEKIHAFFEGCDLGGFNILKFDISALCNNFQRVGLPLSLDGVSVVDACRIFHMREPRDLSAAMAFYTPHFHVGAHSAIADTEASISVFLGQLEMYSDLPTTAKGIHKMIHGEGVVDVGGKIGRLSGGHYCFLFGKHEGEPLYQVPTHYIEWAISNLDFTPDAMKVIRGVLATR